MYVGDGHHGDAVARGASNSSSMGGLVSEMDDVGENNMTLPYDDLYVIETLGSWLLHCHRRSRITFHHL